MGSYRENGGYRGQASYIEDGRYCEGGSDDCNKGQSRTFCLGVEESESVEIDGGKSKLMDGFSAFDER